MHRFLEVFFNCNIHNFNTEDSKSHKPSRRSLQKVTSLKVSDVEMIFCSGIWILREDVLIRIVFLFYFLM